MAKIAETILHVYLNDNKCIIIILSSSYILLWILGRLSSKYNRIWRYVLMNAAKVDPNCWQKIGHSAQSYLIHVCIYYIYYFNCTYKATLILQAKVIIMPAIITNVSMTYAYLSYEYCIACICEGLGDNKFDGMHSHLFLNISFHDFMNANVLQLIIFCREYSIIGGNCL